MKTRIITAIIGLSILVPILIFSDTIAFLILICFICGVASFEILTAAGLNKKWFFSIPTITICTIVPVGTRYFFKTTTDFFHVLFAIVSVYLFYILTVSVFSKGKIRITDVCLSFTMCVYVVTGFVAMIYIRDLQGELRFLFPLIFLGAWGADTFAYFGGKLFGKHKLIPDVSPKKTVEGAVAGIVGTVVLFVIYGFVISSIYKNQLNVLAIILMGFLEAIVSICGDLIMSRVKRHYNVKDFGKLLPGHGGILDRFDSLIPVNIVILMLVNLTSILHPFT